MKNNIWINQCEQLSNNVLLSNGTTSAVCLDYDARQVFWEMFCYWIRLFKYLPTMVTAHFYEDGDWMKVLNIGDSVAGVLNSS